MSGSRESWPALPLDEWQETYATLHMYTQVVGKVRLALAPPMNQWWQVALYVTARGLTTSPIPYRGRTFGMELDFFDHQLYIRDCEGAVRQVALGPAVKEFYREVMAALRELGVEVRIWPMPVEVPDPIRFDQDGRHATYDPDQAHTFWQVLRRADTVFKEFRSRFSGKSSPVHFFWGSFDLAVTRFSGRAAPPPEGADLITAGGYDAELTSLGFWPGGRGLRGTTDGAAFYAYAYPEPPGYKDRPVRPERASYDDQLGEFLLMYDDVSAADDPSGLVLDFAQSTYEAGARLQGWPIDQLELSPGAPPRPEGSRGSVPRA